VAIGLRLCAAAAVGQGEAGPGRSRGCRGRRGEAVSERERGEARARGGAAEETGEAEAAEGLRSLPGVGPALERRFATKGIQTPQDLLLFLPIGYEDRRDVREIRELVEGETATVRGTVEWASVRRGRRGRRILEARLRGDGSEGVAEGEGAVLVCTWFRAHPGLVRLLQVGARVLATGTATRYRGQLQMTHPAVLLDDGARDGAGVRCRYPAVDGVAPGVVAKLCARACERAADGAHDALPESLAARLGLPSLPEALRTIHLAPDGSGGGERAAPSSEELAALARGGHPAQERLVLGELFGLQLQVELRRRAWGELSAPPCPISDEGRRRLGTCFPFELTGAQRRVLEEIWGDLGSGRPMHRLLQGDVGSGKTAVAFGAALAAIECGHQVAVMAPTEILARQHHEVMAGCCRRIGRNAALLTAATPRASRESILALARGGRGIDLLVGTHALLARSLDLPRLALVVVDEQHRFGVLQRARLRGKGEAAGACPHLLVMTATPIPRTLAHALHGDLDLSLLDEKPPGRVPVRTRVFVRGEREAALGRVGAALLAGRRVFVVCPLVEESDAIEAADAVGTARELGARFGEGRVGLVHGRMAPEARARALREFREGAVELLVATTVIEVGIDIPRAGMMVVLHADRFGLAQLHQLRGRVGRDEGESECLLLTEAPEGSEAAHRLAILARTSDGFVVAEADLEHRGPGELFGTRQAGVPRLRFADLARHRALLERARDEARRLLERDPELALAEHSAARRHVEEERAVPRLLGEETG
jgi:ATP-dependent DNA helicase RecG